MLDTGILLCYKIDNVRAFIARLLPPGEPRDSIFIIAQPGQSHGLIAVCHVCLFAAYTIASPYVFVTSLVPLRGGWTPLNWSILVAIVILVCFSLAHYTRTFITEPGTVAVRARNSVC